MADGIYNVPFIGGFAKIVAAPFKLVGNTGMATYSLFTGDTEGFKDSLGGMVNNVIDIPSGVLQTGNDIVTAPKHILGGTTDANTPPTHKIVMGTGNVFDVPSGVIELGSDALDAIRPSRQGLGGTSQIPAPTQPGQPAQPPVYPEQPAQPPVAEAPAPAPTPAPTPDAAEEHRRLNEQIIQLRNKNTEQDATIARLQQEIDGLKNRPASPQPPVQPEQPAQPPVAETPAQPPVQPEQPVQPPVAENPDDKKFNWTPWLIAGGVALAGIAAFFLFRGRGSKVVEQAAKKGLGNSTITRADRLLTYTPDALEEVAKGAAKSAGKGGGATVVSEVVENATPLPSLLDDVAGKKPTYTWLGGDKSVSVSGSLDDLGQQFRIDAPKIGADDLLTAGKGNKKAAWILNDGAEVPADVVVTSGAPKAQGQLPGAKKPAGQLPGTSNADLDYMEPWYHADENLVSVPKVKPQTPSVAPKAPEYNVPGVDADAHVIAYQQNKTWAQHRAGDLTPEQITSTTNTAWAQYDADKAAEALKIQQHNQSLADNFVPPAAPKTQRAPRVKTSSPAPASAPVSNPVAKATPAPGQQRPMGTLEELRPDLARKLDSAVVRNPIIVKDVELVAGKTYRFVHPGRTHKILKTNTGLDFLNGMQCGNGRMWSMEVTLTQAQVEALSNAKNLDKLIIQAV